MKRLIRLIGAVSLIGLFLLSCLFIWGRHNRTRVVSILSRRLLAWLNFRVTYSGPVPPTNAFIVSNHLSYMDVFILSVYFPAVFVTSVEIENTPGLGFISRMGGSIFVERRNTTRLRHDLHVIGRLLRKNHRVVVFPEGTSSDGRGVLPFHGALFVAALGAHAPVMPVCLRYHTVNGHPVRDEDRGDLFYFGDDTFFRNLWALLRFDSLEIDVEALEPLRPPPGVDRKEFVEQVRARIVEAYR